jgi:hypothetical protein
MFARPRAGDVEQPPFGFVDIVQFRGVGDTLVEWQSALFAGITTMARNSKPLARLICAIVLFQR